MPKTVMLSEEAYEALLKEKKKKESFSDVVLRLVTSRAKLSDYVGIWSDIPDKEFQRMMGAMPKGRRGIRARL